MNTQRTILVVTTRPGPLQPFIAALGKVPGWHVQLLDSTQALVDRLGRESPALVVVDGQVGPLSGFDVVRRLIAVNAFVHTALLSELDDAAFHEKGEGLGILTKLCTVPGPQDANSLLDRLRQVLPH